MISPLYPSSNVTKSRARRRNWFRHAQPLKAWTAPSTLQRGKVSERPARFERSIFDRKRLGNHWFLIGNLCYILLPWSGLRLSCSCRIDLQIQEGPADLMELGVRFLTSWGKNVDVLPWDFVNGSPQNLGGFCLKQPHFPWWSMMIHDNHWLIHGGSRPRNSSQEICKEARSWSPWEVPSSAQRYVKKWPASTSKCRANESHNSLNGQADV